jgi:hypothetical protein
MSSSSALNNKTAWSFGGQTAERDSWAGGWEWNGQQNRQTREDIMEKKKRVQTAARISNAAKQTTEAINRRRRRQVVRGMAGAVVGGLIAGPLGVAAGAIVGASRKRGPKARQPAGQPKAVAPTKPAKASKSGKAGGGKRRAISKPGKTTVNIYPPIP